jgi:putative tryptophan/tyrosine transport system substrate-binding protein
MSGKILWLLVTLLLAHVQLAEAQQPKKVPLIGWLAFGTPRLDRQQPFFEGLRSLGWIEGKTITIERRYANESYTRLGEIAAELVRLKVDLIVVRDSIAIRPAMQASNTSPIVMLVSGDPLRMAVLIAWRDQAGTSLVSPISHRSCRVSGWSYLKR